MKNIPPFVILFILITNSLLAIPMERDPIGSEIRNAAREPNASVRNGGSNAVEEARATRSTAIDSTFQEAATLTLSIGKLDEFIDARAQIPLIGEESLDAALESPSSAAQHSATIACYAEQELHAALARADYDEADLKAEALIAAWKEAATVCENGLTAASGESKKLWCKDLTMIEQLIMSAEALRTKIAAERAESIVRATTLIDDQPFAEVLPLLIQQSGHAIEAWEQAAEAFQIGHDKALSPFQPWWKNRLEEVKNSAAIFKIKKLYWQTKKNELAAHELTDQTNLLSHEAAIPVFSSAVTATEKVVKNWSQIARDYQRGLEQAPELFQSYWKTQLNKATLEKDRWRKMLAERKLQQKANQTNYEQEIFSQFQDHNNLFSATVEAANASYKEAQKVNKKSKIEALPLWQEAIRKTEEALAACSLFVEQRSQPLEHVSENLKKAQSQMLQTAQQQKSELEKSLKQSKTNEAISINIQKQKDQAELEALDAAQAQALEKKLKPLRSEISHIESEDKKIEKQIFDLISKIEKKNEPREFNLWEIQELFTQINENSQKSIQNWKNIKSLCKQAFKIISDFSMPESRFSWEPMYSKAKSKLLFLNVSTSSNEATRKTKLLKISILNATSFEESLSLSEKVISEAELRKHYDHFKKVKLLWAETVQHAEMASTSWKEAAETALLRPAYLELQEVETLQQQFENAINNYYAWTAKKIAMEISACKAELNEFAYQAKLTLDLNEALSLWNQAFQKHAEGRLIYDSGIATISSYMTQIPPQFQSWWKSIFIKLMENRNAWHAEQASLEEIKKEDIMIKSPHELEALTTSTTAIEDSIEASEHEKQGK